MIDLWGSVRQFIQIIDDALQYDAHQHCKQILFILLWILLSFVPLSSNSSIRQHRTTYQTAVIDYHHTHIIEWYAVVKLGDFVSPLIQSAKENDTWNESSEWPSVTNKKGNQQIEYKTNKLKLIAINL